MKKRIPSLAELRSICYPTLGHKKDPYRKIALYFLPFILRLPLSPNMVTTLRFAILILSFFLFISSSPFFVALAVFLFHFCILMDTFDGSIARYKGLSSKFGEQYDFVIDHIATSFLFFLAVGVHLFYLQNSSFHLILALSTIFITNASFLLRIFYRIHNAATKDYLIANPFFRFFYQDNGRLIVLLTTLAVIFSFLSSLNIFFFIFSLFKFIFLLIFFIYKEKKSPFSYHSLLELKKAVQTFHKPKTIIFK